MIETLPFIDAAMKYLIVPAVVWVWMLHKTQNINATDISVLRAEAAARDVTDQVWFPKNVTWPVKPE